MKKQENKPCCGNCRQLENLDVQGRGWCTIQKKNRAGIDKYCKKYLRKI